MQECIFCNRGSLDLLMENSLSFAVRDRFPVRPLHTLVLPKRHARDTFDLTAAELQAMFDLGRQLRDAILEADPAVRGYNFGSNNGPVAGQRIEHVHFHLIPRREGEGPLPAATAQDRFRTFP